MGAEFGSCCRSARAILIGILQNRQEMQFSRKDRLAQGSYDAEVGRQRREGKVVEVYYLPYTPSVLLPHNPALLARLAPPARPLPGASSFLLTQVTALAGSPRLVVSSSRPGLLLLLQCRHACTRSSQWRWCCRWHRPLNCVAICITQQAHRCSGELQVPSVRPSVAFTGRSARGRRAGAGRRTPRSRAYARRRRLVVLNRVVPARGGRHPRTRAGYNRAEFSLNLLACPSRLRISVFPFFLRSSRFSPRKKQWRRRTELAKPRCRDPQKHQCRDHENTNAYGAAAQCLHT
eukprot:COSAG03_NODE_1145_length_4725_cov_2.878513_3_plen_291_part_00